MHLTFNKNSAFSVAEAMITLLIVSVALAASAPLISRQVKNNAAANLPIPTIPSGAVMAFDLDACPPTWSPLTNRYAGTEDAFIRNIGTTAGTKGTIKNPGLPNIRGYLGRNGDFGFATNGNYRLEGAFYVTTDRLPFRTEGNNSTFSYNVAFDASRSNPIYNDSVTEVRPKSLALLYCRKN